MKVNPVKGVHDIFDKDALDLKRIETIAAMVANNYGYSPIVIPTIEQTALFARDIKDSSDMVTKEMYTFLDKGNRSLSLRPEFTAGIIRAIVHNKLYALDDLPLRLFYEGSCFRYERPQAGRYREFHQLGVELVDEPSIYNDVEVLLLGYRIITALEIPCLVKINYLPKKESRENYLNALRDYFAPQADKLCEDCQRRLSTNPLRILDCKVSNCQKIIANAPKINDYLSLEEISEFNKIQSLIKESEVDFNCDSTLVRGLDYYSGLVFEYHIDSSSGDLVGAVGGGGRYDKLIEELGGPANLVGTGFSLGLERLLYVYQNSDNYEESDKHIAFYFISMDEKALPIAFYTAELIRSEIGLPCYFEPRVKSAKSGLRAANKKHALYAVIIGEEEVEKGIVSIKNLKSGEQTGVDMSNLISVLTNIFDEENEDLDGEDVPQTKKS